MTWVKWNLTSFCLDTVLVSVQDSFMVCARHTISSKIILMHPMVPLCDEAQVEARFGTFRDSAHFDAR